MSEVLKVEKRNGLAFLTMNRPDKRNSLSKDLQQELIAALKEAEEDAEVKGIILSGSGKAFCAGGDIDSMSPGAKPHDIVESMNQTTEVIKTILNLNKYVVAAVQGFAAGAGFSLALACDFVVASKEAKFVCSFRNIGLAPDLGLIKLLANNVPLPVAKEWVVSGRMISAQEVYDRGLINQLSTDEQLLEDAVEFSQFIVEGPPIANRYTKYLLNNADQWSHDESIMQENFVQTLLFQTEDAKNAIQAFLNKEKPEFKGK